MSYARPIAASSRQLDIPAQPGQVTFAWPLPLFDPADLEVQLQVAPATLFQPVTGGVSVTPAPDSSSAVVAFLQPPCTVQGQAIVVRLIGRRVQSRLGNVTRGGAVSSSWLEDELDRESLVLQELRRDVDQAVAGAAQALILAGGLVPQPTVSLWQLASALALRGELAGLLPHIQVLASGDALAIAFGSRDSVFAPGDAALAEMTALLGDANAAVSQARLALAASLAQPPGWNAAALRTSVAQLGLLGALERAMPAEPTSPARIEWDMAVNVAFAGPVIATLAVIAGPAVTLALLPLAAANVASSPQASLRQLRMVLAALGLLPQAEAAIEMQPEAAGAFGLTTADLASIQWLSGTGVSAGDALSLVLAPVLGLSSLQWAQVLAYAGQVLFA